MTVSPETFASAVAYAARAHSNQFRKRSAGDDRPRIPYLSHLLGVAGLVLEDLGSTDEAIAGLLHDVLEDQDPDHVRADEIEREFGPDELSMVKACSGPKSEDEGMAVATRLSNRVDCSVDRSVTTALGGTAARGRLGLPVRRLAGWLRPAPRPRRIPRSGSRLPRPRGR